MGAANSFAQYQFLIFEELVINKEFDYFLKIFIQLFILLAFVFF
tara:strand:+ start:485 stop:616 length:132 start_codon:yes stop_codon:yes gene_type:complete